MRGRLERNQSKSKFFSCKIRPSSKRCRLRLWEPTNVILMKNNNLELGIFTRLLRLVDKPAGTHLSSKYVVFSGEVATPFEANLSVTARRRLLVELY